MAKQKKNAAISRIEERSKRQIAEMEARFREKTRDMFIDELYKAIQKGEDPSSLFHVIESEGFDSSSLLDKAIEKLEAEARNKVKEQFVNIISNLLKNNPKASLQDTIAWFESQQEDVEIDLVTEAYNKTISNFKSDYQHVVETAARIMRLEDVDAGIAYINKYENISIIAACAGETVSDCIKTAKGRVVKQYEGEINAENKKLSKYVILLLVGVGVLVYGLCEMSYFLIIIGAIVAIIYVRKFPKYMQKKKMLKMLIEKK